MVRIVLLGGVELQGKPGPEPALLLDRPKQTALLTYLLLGAPGEFLRRDSLTALFWPESDHVRARAALRQALFQLRRALGAECVITRGDEVGVDPARVRCDVWELEGALASGHLAEAMTLYRGPLLPGFHLGKLFELERWLEDERQRLQRRAGAAATRLLERAEAEEDPDSAATWARRILQLAPYDEKALRGLLRALDRSGERAEALRAFDAFALRLSEDLEADPEEETRALAGRVRSRLVETGTQAGGPPGERNRLEGAGAGTGAPGGKRPPLHGPDSTAENPSGEGSRPPEPPTRRPLRAALAGAATLMAIVGGILAGALLLTRSEAATVSDRVVAVFPFSVTGSDEVLYLREGLADLLAGRLDGAGGLAVVDPNALLGSLARSRPEDLDPDAARRIGVRYGAGLHVISSVLVADERLGAKSSLYDARGRLLGTAEGVAESQAELFGLADDLARGLLALAPSAAPGRFARVGSLRTESFPALKAHLEGERLLRAGKLESAAAAWERAVETDPDFALAYYRMAVARHQHAAPVGIADGHRRALELGDGLSARDRALVEAFDAFKSHRDQEAERRYREVLSLHPDEVEAWVFLGQVLLRYGLWRGRPVADVRQALERALELDPGHPTALHELSWVAAVEERFGEGAALSARILEAQPDAYLVPALRARIALAGNDSAEFQAALGDLRRRDSPFLEWAQRHAHFSGDLEGRLQVASLLVEEGRSDRSRVRGHVVSARVHLDRGRPGQALRELARVEALDPDGFLLTWARFHLRPLVPMSRAGLLDLGRRLEGWSPEDAQTRLARLYLRGLVSVHLEDAEGAEARAILLDSQTDEPELARDLALGLRAWALARQERPAEALALLDRMEPEAWFRGSASGGFQADARQTWLRAELLAELGRPDEALALYAPLGWLWGDAGLLAPKHLRMAGLYQRLGDEARASHHYRRFAEVWEGAEPGLVSLVEEVRTRVGDEAVPQSPSYRSSGTQGRRP